MFDRTNFVDFSKLKMNNFNRDVFLLIPFNSNNLSSYLISSSIMYLQI